MIGSYENRGLNMTDIESHFESLKASWIGRILNKDIASWQLIPLKYLQGLG